MIQKLSLDCESGYTIFCLHDVSYKRAKCSIEGLPFMTRALPMQILIPKSVAPADAAPLPIVVFACGGGFRTPLVQSRVPWLTHLAEQGFLVVMPEYRGCEIFDYTAAVSDLRSAVRFIRKNASMYGGDPERIFLMGASAGGHLSLMAAYSGSLYDDPHDDLTVSAEVSGVIDLYGPADFLSAAGLPGSPMREKAAWILKKDSGSLTEDDLSRISPVSLVSASCPPTLICHGTGDPIVNFQHSLTLHDCLQSCGCSVHCILIDGALHADRRFFDPYMIQQYSDFIRSVT